MQVQSVSGQGRHQLLIGRTKNFLEGAGFKVVIVGNKLGKTPDLVAVKDGELYQIEVETSRGSHSHLMSKLDKQYDKALFFCPGENLQVAKLYDTIDPKRQ